MIYFHLVYPFVIACIAWWEGMKMLEIFAYPTVVHFTYQNWFSRTVYCIRHVIVRKVGFTNWNAKIALWCGFMAVTYYIKLFLTGADRHNGTLVSLLLLVAETITTTTSSKFFVPPCYAQNLRRLIRKRYFKTFYLKNE